MDEITKLMNEYYDNDGTLKRLNERQFEIRKQVILSKYGIKQGSIVKTPDGKLYKVSKIHGGFKPFDKPFIDGAMQKKDGTFSTQSHRWLGATWEPVEA